ncbi:MAG TPA: hypothetical protein VLF69_05290 [Candidatus Saccharimonadales bacterium]|nr:hypothetical protein [Candidatus Saccharimonadales bacterium]
MDQAPTSKTREALAALAVLIVIVVIVSGATLSAHKQANPQLAATVSIPASTKQTTPSNAGNTTTPPATTSSSGTAANSSGYTDGTYRATGFYDSPDGTEAITISVTLQNGVITSTSAQAGAQDPDAAEYQDLFISSYKQLVVGKSITSVRLSRVSGASLTPIGFNNAISKIQQQAHHA